MTITNAMAGAMRRWLWMVLFALCAVAPRAQAAGPLAAGPMAGVASMRSALIWLQGRAPVQVQIEYWDESTPGRAQRTPPQGLQPSEDFATKIAINGLQPGRRYGYRVLFDGVPVDGVEPLWFTTQALWQWRTEPPDFSVAMGSCNYVNEPEFDRPGKPYGADHSIFSAIAARKPDMMLWLGDNTYLREADLGSPWGMAARWRHDRAQPELQALLRTGHHYAIWDDHDYGPNDANASFIHKDVSLELFRRYWPNPGFGLPRVPGTFSVASFNDVDFFLLDDRTYRDADRAADFPGKTMFGREQLAWLKNALLNSTATFKLIAAGGQMLNEINRFEGWRHFPEERREFLAWLERQRLDGVLFLSGDRHHTELIRLDRPRLYPLYELTCSPLTAGPHDDVRERAKPNLVPGTFVGQRNFCSIEFQGPRKGRRLVMKAFDSSGVELWKHELSIRDLSLRALSATP